MADINAELTRLRKERDELRAAARELLELVSDADVVPSTAHNPFEWDTIFAAAVHRLRALAEIKSVGQ